MPNTASRTVQLVRSILQIPNQDTLVYDTDISDAMVSLAISEFSRRRPRNISQDYIGNNENSYAMPTYWSDDFSFLKGIYLSPAGFVEDDNEIDQNEYKVVIVDDTSRSLSVAAISTSTCTLATAANAAYFKDGNIVELKASSASSGETNWVAADGNSSTGVVTLKNAIAATYASPVIRKKKHILFVHYAFTSSDVFSVKYTGLHIHTTSSNTVSDGDYGAFTHLVAALTAYAIAAQFSQVTSPSIEGDAIGYDGLAEMWNERGRTQYALFAKHVGETEGIGEGASSTAAGSHFGDLDVRGKYSRQFLLHPSSKR